MEEKKGATVPVTHATSPEKPETLNPEIQGKLRSGRDDNRPTEDDIARQRMGPRGLPGEPAQKPDLPESETQIPKGLDPGHTA